MLTGDVPLTRDAKEVCFENLGTLLQIPGVIDKAVLQARGDNKEFLRLLFEALMRLRTFGAH